MNNKICILQLERIINKKLYENKYISNSEYEEVENKLLEQINAKNR